MPSLQTLRSSSRSTVPTWSVLCHDSLHEQLLTLLPSQSTTTTFKLETIDGGSNPQGASEAGIEANLDVQYTVGVATGVPVYFLSVGDNYQDGGLEGFLDTVNFVSQENPVTYVLTTSYGQNENTMSRALATKLCNAYASVGAPGGLPLVRCLTA
jgi:tripeptidyl-peptidase-1